MGGKCVGVFRRFEKFYDRRHADIGGSLSCREFFSLSNRPTKDGLRSTMFGAFGSQIGKVAMIRRTSKRYAVQNNYCSTVYR